HRNVDLGPIAPLIEQSPVLDRFAHFPHGTRTIDTLKNLPMVAGAAPVGAYRTLDLPALQTLTALAIQLPRHPGEGVLIGEAMRLTGAAYRVYEPPEVQEMERSGSDRRGFASDKLVHDPALAGWRFGVDLVAQQGPRASTFRVRSVEGGKTLARAV